MRIGRFVAMVALVLAVLPFAGGTVQAAEDGIYHLGEVVVSGQEPGVEAVGVTHKVTAEEIEQRGARTLDEAINLLPGVNVRTGGDGKPRIDIRGFRTRHVKLLLNGTPFNSTYDGQFDPNIISVENIAEIVVTSGGSSVLYGSGGNAGVINIITRKGAKGVHGSAGVELAEGDAQLLHGTGSYGADKYDVFLSGSVYEQDYFELSDHFSPTELEDGGERENSDRRRNNFFANAGYSPTDATLIGLTFTYLSGEHGKPPVAVDDDFAPGLRFEREDDMEEFNVQLAVDHDIAGPFSVKGWAYFNQLDLLENRYDRISGTHTSDYESQTRRNSFMVDSTTEISGVNLQLRYDFERFGALTLAGMFENDDWEADGFNNENNNDPVPIDADRDFQLYSTALEYEVSPLKNLGIVLGAGYHWQDRDEKDEEEYSYLIGAHYDILEGTRLKASHARKIRFPTLRDLYEEPSDRANPDLGAEVTWHTEAGIEQDLPVETRASLTVFYIDIEDFIERPESGEPAENFEEYEFYGVEVGAENRYFERLFLRASYSYLHTKDKSPDSGRDQIQNDPEHKVVLEATCQLPWNLSLYGSGRWVANAYAYNGDDTEKKRIPEYLVFDFRINKRVAEALDLYFGLNNAFDADYESSYGFPQAGRTMYGGVNWKF